VAQGHSCWDPSQSLWHWLSRAPLTTKATPLDWPCISYALQPTPSSHTLRGISQWAAVAWPPKVAVHGPYPLYREQVQYTVELEQLSTDRDTWKSACASGLATYNVAAEQAAAEDRRTRRHNPPNLPTTGPRCPQCSRICASEFGLRSHYTESCLTSTSATLLAAQTSSSNSTDYCKQASWSQRAL